MNLVFQLIDYRDGQRSNPKLADRSEMVRSFKLIAEKDPNILDSYVLVIMEPFGEGDDYRYSVTPLLTVRSFIDFFSEE